MFYIVTGHAPNSPSIQHKKSKTYPWIAICPSQWEKKFENLSETKVTALLSELPYVRHAEVNPEQYLPFKPVITFNCIMDGIIGVRSAVAAGYGWSLVPAMSVQSLAREKKIFTIDINPKIKDEFSLWWIRD